MLYITLVLKCMNHLGLHITCLSIHLSKKDKSRSNLGVRVCGGWTLNRTDRPKSCEEASPGKIFLPLSELLLISWTLRSHGIKVSTLIV